MNLKKSVDIAGEIMGRIMPGIFLYLAIIALDLAAKWIGKMGRELFLLERENINRRVLKRIKMERHYVRHRDSGI
jgi:hypothetical protein